MFRLEYRVFLHTHAAPFLRSRLPLLVVGFSNLTRRIPNPTASIRIFEISLLSCRKSPALESLSVLPASSTGPGILCKQVSEGHQFESSLPPFLVSTVFRRPSHEFRTSTLGGCVGRKHRRSYVDVQSCFQPLQSWVVVVVVVVSPHTHDHCFKLVTRPAHSAHKHNRTPPRLEAN